MCSVWGAGWRYGSDGVAGRGEGSGRLCPGRRRPLAWATATGHARGNMVAKWFQVRAALGGACPLGVELALKYTECQEVSTC